jgi:hypothetical protein
MMRLSPGSDRQLGLQISPAILGFPSTEDFSRSDGFYNLRRKQAIVACPPGQAAKPIDILF